MGSFLEKITSRQRWFSICGEMANLCQESTRRRLSVPRRASTKANPVAIPRDFIADRLDTDDPLSGYCVRCRDTGWLQGFVTFTTFTTWTHWFQWNSRAAESQLSTLPGPIRDWGLLEERALDYEGELSSLLEKQERTGNADAEGVVWPRVAELGCIGSLGCGKFLMELVINEMVRSQKFDWLVLQATHLSVPFYEMLGFVRVGCVARYAAKGANFMGAPVVAYKHWTYPDMPSKLLAQQPPSYMMALKIGCAGRKQTRSLSRGAVVTDTAQQYFLRNSKEWPRIKVLKAGSKEAERARVKVEAMDRVHYSRDSASKRGQVNAGRRGPARATTPAPVPTGPRSVSLEVKVCVKCKGTYGMYETKKAVARLSISVNADDAKTMLATAHTKGKSRRAAGRDRLKIQSLLQKQVTRRLRERDPPPMYNCVVTIQKERSVIGGTRRFDYNSSQNRRRFFFVMKYNPDTTMCSLVPLVKCGVFSATTNCAGQLKWRLVPEGKGKELYLPAREMSIVPGAVAVLNDPDADRERWYIPTTC